MGPNMSKFVQHVLNRSKQVKAGENCYKQAQHGWNIFQNSVWLTKMALKCFKWSKIVNVGLKGYKMIQNGLKWSNMVKYDIIWSNMVQMLSLRLSKWVQHNLVSWSSLTWVYSLKSCNAVCWTATAIPGLSKWENEKDPIKYHIRNIEILKHWGPALLPAGLNSPYPDTPDPAVPCRGFYRSACVLL